MIHSCGSTGHMIETSNTGFYQNMFGESNITIR